MDVTGLSSSIERAASNLERNLSFFLKTLLSKVCLSRELYTSCYIMSGCGRSSGHEWSFSTDFLLITNLIKCTYFTLCAEECAVGRAGTRFVICRAGEAATRQ